MTLDPDPAFFSAARSQADHRRLFEQAIVGLLEIAFDGEILLINPSGAALLGYTPQELTGRNVLSITHPGDIEKTERAFASVIGEETDVAVLDKRYLHSGGRVVWSRSRLALFRGVQGEAHSCVAVVSDITELKEIQLSLREANAQLQATLEGSLLALGLALEARDLETSGHTQRVVDLSMHLARALGLSSAKTTALRHGAYLHDIGKLTIPDAVLLKPGPLDSGEGALMQTHASAGHEMALRMPALAPGALLVIRHHHERWDGTGYPDGLRGEAIPLLARIFAVCDVYDALTSRRPYKPAWTAPQALAELSAQRGKQFDPVIVNAFIEARAFSVNPSAPLDGHSWSS